MRLDLAIAVCALLISTVAASASWWQARVLQAQTQVLEQQLGAQVWPYVSVESGFDNDRMQIDASNDGLGPAILGSAVATVDGIPRSSFIDILHALLGPHLVARARARGDRIGFTIDNRQRGSVIRPGSKGFEYSFTSRSFAQELAKASDRLKIRICYCAILPGKCWIGGSDLGGPPKPVPGCPEVAGDLLHERGFAEIQNGTF